VVNAKHLRFLKRPPLLKQGDISSNPVAFGRLRLASLGTGKGLEIMTGNNE
jgi:hypothetical protein